MEGRRIFAELTVDENLRAGALHAPAQAAESSESYERVHGAVPGARRAAPQSTAGYLSGGEQQMLAMGRALMADPRLLLLDEPSLGLAPLIVEQIRDIIVEINAQGTSVLLVEQNATMALSIAAARLRPGERPGRQGRRGRGAARRQGHPGVLPGRRRRRAGARSAT